MSHLWGRGWSSIVILDHTVMKLWGHSNDHVIVVWVEISTFWDIKTERRIVVISSHQVVRVVDETWRVRKSLGKIWRPDTHVGVLSLMHGHIWRPHSIVDDSLSVVPLLEEISSVFLMTWMDLWKIDHLFGEFSLSETLVHQKIVFLMDSSVTTLTGSLEDLETSSQSG